MAINKEYQLTKDGLKELQNEMENLKTQRPEVAEKIKTAREFGDLSENDEYASARDEQARIESRLSELEYILQNYEIINGNKKSQTVGLGSTVVLVNGDKKQAQYNIVGSVEADPAEGKISDESPIGQALMGKKVGEKVEIELPAGKKAYKVKAIK
jgi:transcription elongation factor GreA